MPIICTNNILHLLCLVLFNPTYTENNGKGQGIGRVTIMDNNKFDFNGLMNHKIKNKITLKRKNEPNLDRMADAFFKLLRKK
jgi:hypothetical protein